VDYNKVLKALKKTFCCNGTVVEDPEQARLLARCEGALAHPAWLTPPRRATSSSCRATSARM